MKNNIQKLLTLLFLSLAFFSCNLAGSGHHDTGDAVVSYNANGADYGSIPTSHGSEQAIQRNIGNLEKNGYIFDGWNSSPDGSGSDYAPGSSSPAKSMTLYAKWALVFNYTVSNSMHVSSSSMGVSSASGSYLHITGLTERGRKLEELAITETIDGYSVTSIKARAFQACSNIKKVTIAGSVRSIGDNAFARCSNLETLIMKGEEPPEMGTGVLDYCSPVISVPPGAKDTYSNKAGWSSYNSLIVTYYTVTFRSGNADIDAYPSEKQVVYPATTIDALPAEPVRSGYIFSGWYTGLDGTGSLFTAITEVISDLTVYAKWVPANQNSGIRLKFSIVGFKDARVPSHLFQNNTPELNATYYYKATPRWTSDLRTVVGATEDFVQLPYSYSIKTQTVDMGFFTPGAWDFDVRVVSSNGITLYEKAIRNCDVNSQISTVEFGLEKRYEGTGTLQINAVSDFVSSGGGLIISYKGTRSGNIIIPVEDSLPGADGTVSFKKTLSLPPGFYVVNLTLYEDRLSKAVKSGYIEVFSDETSVLNGTVYKDIWMAESYTDVGVSGGFLLSGKKKLGMIISTYGNSHSDTWRFTASQTEDSDEIGTFVWYVNGIRQNVTGSEFILRNITSGSYLVNCFAVDKTFSYIVGAGLTIPIQ